MSIGGRLRNVVPLPRSAAASDTSRAFLILPAVLVMAITLAGGYWPSSILHPIAMVLGLIVTISALRGVEPAVDSLLSADRQGTEFDMFPWCLSVNGNRRFHGWLVQGAGVSGVTGSILLCFVLVFPSLVPDSIVARMGSLSYSEASSSAPEEEKLDKSSSTRLVMWRAGAHMILEEPFRG